MWTINKRYRDNRSRAKIQFTLRRSEDGAREMNILRREYFIDGNRSRITRGGNLFSEISNSPFARFYAFSWRVISLNAYQV